MAKTTKFLLISVIVVFIAVFFALQHPNLTSIDHRNTSPFVPDPLSVLDRLSYFFLGLNEKLIDGSSLPETPVEREPVYVTIKDADDDGDGLVFDFYRDTCPIAEGVVRSTVKKIYARHPEIAPAFLRLHFHDCFISGCDASILLDDRNGNISHRIEKNSVPNQTLRGLSQISAIKKDLEAACPGTVSCADTIALATRDAILLAGGPFYPILTGRRDSMRSYYDEANAQIPKPDGNISETLRLFSLRGFSSSETVALLGGHSIGRVGCAFFQSRFNNFNGTGRSDPSLPSNFSAELKSKCSNGTSHVSLGTIFDTHYYNELTKGRGVLFSDQQLMADPTTAETVVSFATADDSSLFQREFAAAMVKMSILGALTGGQGEVRANCSLSLAST